ncbi:hypothetical protein CRYUN_Cryun25bG0112500 [Craigia yunnanensis]
MMIGDQVLHRLKHWRSLISAQDISIFEGIRLGTFGMVLISVMKWSILLGSGTRGRPLQTNQQLKH